MIDTIIAILAVGLPVAFVAFLAWVELDFKWKNVLVYFLALGAPVVIVLFWNPFTNLTDWQLGVFGVLFALALVGVHHLIEQGGTPR